jgi:catechol 2,3-dioxygenase-like lactoylglutathione lyase family enzyme
MSYNLGIVILSVSDLQKSRDFYSHKLGLPVVEEQSSEHFIAMAPANGGLIALSPVAPGKAVQPGGVELGLEVADVDATWREWRRLGLSGMSEPADTPFGRSFDAKDPDGHPLSIYQLGKK